MPRSLLWPDPRVKPPFGVAEVEWGHPLARSLSALWLFNEEAGAAIDLVAGIPATPTNGAIRSMGARGVAGSFARASSQYFSASSQQAVDLIKPFSAVCRIRPTVAFSNYESVINHQSVSGGHSQYGMLLTSDGKWYAQSATQASADIFFLSSTALILNAESDLVITVDAAGTLTGYANAASVGSTSGADPPSYATDLTIGADIINGRYYDGLIHGVTLYRTRALSSDEIAWHYAEPYAMLRPIIRRRYSIPHKIGPLIHAGSPQLITAGGSIGGATL